MQTIDKIRMGLRKRYAAERRFRRIGQISIFTGFMFLVVLLTSIIGKGYGAFLQTYMQLDIHYDRALIAPDGRHDPKNLAAGDYAGVVKAGMRRMYPDIKKRKDKRKLYKLVSDGAAFQLQRNVLQNPTLIGETHKVWVSADDEADMFFKGHVSPLEKLVPASSLTLTPDGEEFILKTEGQSFVNIRDRLKEHLRNQRREAEARILKKQSMLNSAVAESNLLQRQYDRFIHDGEYLRADNAKRLLDDIAVHIEQYQNEVGLLDSERSALDARLRFDEDRQNLPNDMPSYLVAVNGGYLKLTAVGLRQASGRVLLPLSSNTHVAGGDWYQIELETPLSERRVTDKQVAVLLSLHDAGRIHKRFNTTLFTAGDSREPELAGIASALKGTMYMLIVTLLLSFPIGAATAIYLEEFAPQSRWTDMIEVNINNLAAVPSIIFGLLGLAIFINFAELPRSAPLVGGMVLTLMTLPTIIIASRAALKSVSPSIREAALGIGASRVQMIFHHVLPLAVPGMMTGTIIGMAQALGESAPLLMIGMVAFIVDVPQGFMDPATALPVQIYLWADSPERAFLERTSAAIMVLLVFLVAMNALAVVLRKRFEHRW